MNACGRDGGTVADNGHREVVLIGDGADLAFVRPHIDDGARPDAGIGDQGIIQEPLLTVQISAAAYGNRVVTRIDAWG